jgi:hypothetical protein
MGRGLLLRIYYHKDLPVFARKIYYNGPGEHQGIGSFTRRRPGIVPLGSGPLRQFLFSLKAES